MKRGQGQSKTREKPVTMRILDIIARGTDQAERLDLDGDEVTPTKQQIMAWASDPATTIGAQEVCAVMDFFEAYGTPEECMMILLRMSRREMLRREILKGFHEVFQQARKRVLEGSPREEQKNFL